MTTNEILIKARDLIANPGNWSPLASGRECHCAATAIWKVADPEFSRSTTAAAMTAGEALAKAADIEWDRQWFRIYDWNDEATHAVVIAAFDRAIEATS